MSGANFNQIPSAIIGRLGEIAASEALRLDGASTISLCRIDDGGAPMLETGSTRRDHKVLPDLQVFNWKHASGCRFFEIKTYAQSAKNDILSKRQGYECRVHGIPVRLFDHYVSTETTTGAPVHLAINELDTGELRISDVSISKLDRIACQCRGGCRSRNAPKHIPQSRGIKEMQWYFDREDLSIVYRHSDKTIANLRRSHSRQMRPGHIWERHGSDRTPSPKVMSLDDPCGRCSKTTPDMFSVGALDGSDGCFRMCATCWRGGDPAEPLKQR